MNYTATARLNEVLVFSGLVLEVLPGESSAHKGALPRLKQSTIEKSFMAPMAIESAMQPLMNAGEVGTLYGPQAPHHNELKNDSRTCRTGHGAVGLTNRHG